MRFFSLFLQKKFLLAAWLLVSVFLIGARLHIGGGIPGGDSIRYYSYLRSMVVEYSLDFERSFNYFHNHRSQFTGLLKLPSLPNKNPVTGRYEMLYPLGTMVSWLPFFLLGDAAAQVAYWLTGDLQYLTGFDQVHYFFTSLSALFYAGLGVYLIWRYLVKIEKIAPLIAWLAGVSVLLGSSLTFYLYFEPTTSHAVSFFWTSWFIVYFLEKYRANSWQKKNFFVLGLLLSMVALTRYQDVFVAVVPLAVLVFDYVKNKKLPLPLTAGNIFSFLGGVLLISWPQLAINNYLHGAWLTTGYRGLGFYFWLQPKIFYILFSWPKGLLVITPLVWLALVGLVSKLKEKIYLALSLFLLLQIYLVAAWASFHQGESFGIRMLVNCSLVLVFGLVPVYQKLFNVKRWLPVAVSLFFIGLNWLLMVLYALRVFGSPYDALF